MPCSFYKTIFNTFKLHILKQVLKVCFHSVTCVSPFKSLRHIVWNREKPAVCPHDRWDSDLGSLRLSSHRIWLFPFEFLCKTNCHFLAKCSSNPHYRLSSKRNRMYIDMNFLLKLLIEKQKHKIDKCMFCDILRYHWFLWWSFFLEDVFYWKYHV